MKTTEVVRVSALAACSSSTRPTRWPGGIDYGTEAIDTLVKVMEDHRDDLAVIVAGYPDPMGEFIPATRGSPAGSARIVFPDYTDAELVEILAELAGASDYTVTDEAETRFRGILAGTARDQAFGNGRFARNLLEEAIGRHAWRLRDEPAPTPEQLRELLAEDFQAAELDGPTETSEPVTSEPVELVDIEPGVNVGRSDSTSQPPETQPPKTQVEPPQTGAPA